MCGQTKFDPNKHGKNKDKDVITHSETFYFFCKCSTVPCLHKLKIINSRAIEIECTGCWRKTEIQSPK